MSDNVAEPVGDESPAEVADEAPAEATPPAEDPATLLRRLRGKDQALTKAARERDEYRSKVDELSRKIAEYEQSNMTEVERLAQERDKFKALAAQAQEEARKHALARKSPLYAEYLDLSAGLDPTSDEAVETFEEFLNSRLKAARGGDLPEETEPEPRIDPNRPRREPPEPPRRKTTAELEEELKRLPADALLGR